jgi:hypothetical protein
VTTPSNTQTQLTQQEVLSAELDGLDEDMSKLQVLYEKYFIGIDRRPPDDERKRLSKRMRELRTTVVRNTGVKFRINTLFAKLISFERLWDRTLREIEEGTYKRDVFKAKYRMNRRAEETPEQPRPPVPRAEISDDKLRRLFDTYLVARQRTGESTDGLTFEKVAQRIRAQVPQLMEKHGAKSVEFKVVIKGGRAVLKAIPHTE